jgi:diazepam-binding inhibitor (GABA receptor modulating acyl-CoA-binding protein)
MAPVARVRQRVSMRAQRTARRRIDRFRSACCHVHGPEGRQTMPTSDMSFEQAARDVQSLPERPDNETLLQLYALYKQGSEGDVSGDKPGFFDFVGTAKFEAWTRLKGMPRDTARQQYVELVQRLKG